MPGTIKDQFLRKAGLLPSLSKQTIYGAQVTRSRTLRRKDPALRLCAAVRTQELEDATAHGKQSSPFRSLAVRHKDHPIFPIEIFDAHAVEFPLLSHPGISHQGHDVSEEFKGSPPPAAGLGSFKQSVFRSIIKPKMPPMLLHQFDFRSVADHLPLLCFVKHSSQCSQSTAGIRC